MADFDYGIITPPYGDGYSGTIRITGGPFASTPTPERTKALDEAKTLINGDRQEEYGTPQVNFQRIVDLWNVLIPRPDRSWSRGDVALALLGLKMARAAQGYKRDTYIDIAGYAGLAVELNEMEDE